MPKPFLKEPFASMERDIIDVLLAGLKQWRPDLDYPQSHSDMQGCIRNMLVMFEVKRRIVPFTLPIDDSK
jgi:hypothetical protein